LLRLLIEALQTAIGKAFPGRIAVYTASGITLMIYSAALAVFETERDQPALLSTLSGRRCGGR